MPNDVCHRSMCEKLVHKTHLLLQVQVSTPSHTDTVCNMLNTVSRLSGSSLPQEVYVPFLFQPLITSENLPRHLISGKRQSDVGIGAVLVFRQRHLTETFPKSRGYRWILGWYSLQNCPCSDCSVIMQVLIMKAYRCPRVNVVIILRTIFYIKL